MTDQGPLWYFAYGANMTSVVLARRAVQPMRSAPATLTGYGLRFNHPGVPPLEPVFANIEPAPAEHVYGVAHLITAAEAAIFDGFEPGYRRISVDLQLAGGEEVEAFAYTTVAPGPEGIPSARYLGLLIDGAREHQLPPTLVQQLEALRTQASTISQDGLTAPDLERVNGRRSDEHLPADLIAQWERKHKEGATE